MVQEWECDECGFVFKGSRAPSRCPECNAAQSAFYLLDDEDEEDDLEDLEDLDDLDDMDDWDEEFDDDED